MKPILTLLTALLLAPPAALHAAETSSQPAKPDNIAETESLIAATQKLRAQLAADAQRPRYHFLPPEAWMNDINGLIFWKGRYHLFYQYNPEGGYWKWMQWGHASSADLVHWVHHPIALTPDRGGPDRDGCFSGMAFVNKEGIPTFIYHGVPDGTCIATSTDDLLIHWQKNPANPVIKVPKPGDSGHGKYIVFDPCAWLDGDTYYALIGNRVPGIDGDCTSLFRSSDLVHWEHVGPFYQSERRWTDSREDCAVPDFFPLGEKHMLLFCSHLQGSQYYLGKLRNNRLEVESHGWLCWPGGLLGGPQAMLDGKGRRVFFDWICERRGGQREAGWSGVATLPRLLSLGADGGLRIDPAPEVEILRMNPRQRQDLPVKDGAELPLADIRGDSLELALEIDPARAREVGVKLRCSADKSEETAVVWVPEEKKLKIDMSRSSLAGIQYSHYRNLKANELLPEDERWKKTQDAPLELAAGEPLRLRIFIDCSVLEVFANGRQCITQRIYPTRADSSGVALFSRGGDALVKSLQAWDIAPAH